MGIATSLTRLAAPETRPASALVVRDVQARGDAAGVAVALPSAARERSAIARAFPGARLIDLAGDRATPSAVLEAATSAGIVHFAVHGFDPEAAQRSEGGFLQLAGEGGRLSAREVARAQLAPGSRVVLSACNAASISPHGLSWAFARAGAVAGAFARDRIDDESAAAWSERFYAALARGRSFVQANREAQQESDRAPLFAVVK